MAAVSPEAKARKREWQREYDRRRRTENAERQRRYRERLRADPVKWAEYQEKHRDEMRLYYLEHPEKPREWKASHPERVRATKRKARRRMKETDPEGLREADHQRYLRESAKPGYSEKKREAGKRRAAADPNFSAKSRLAAQRHIHGPDWATVYAAMWDAQDGLCYLCGSELPADSNTHIDHDHRCCPSHKSCSYCRRGLACAPCNAIIGLAKDKPALLRLIADRLEAMLVTMPERLAAKPTQESLFPDSEAS